MRKKMGKEDKYAPLFLGYDDGNGKYDPVLSVFRRNTDGGYILVKTFSGSEALKVYENLTGKEVGLYAISKSSL